MLNDLPVLVLNEITLYLQCHDIVNLSQSSSYLHEELKKLNYWQERQIECDVDVLKYQPNIKDHYKVVSYAPTISLKFKCSPYFSKCCLNANLDKWVNNVSSYVSKIINSNCIVRVKGEVCGLLIDTVSRLEDSCPEFDVSICHF